MERIVGNIYAGADCSREIKEILAGHFAVTDSNVFSLYRDYFKAAAVVPAGEGSKTFFQLEALLNRFLDAGLDRGSCIAAVGGGVTGDLAGFAAACYMRGIRFLQIPTTLLAMVDSSIGGKTGVNLSSLKNSAGAFWQPERVIISAHFLDTLPAREFVCGMGEILKTAALDKGIFDFCLQNFDALLARDRDAVYSAILLCARKKHDIVSKDERESGLRKILNLGHTLGHAFESMGNFALSHGEYVLMGMEAEARLFPDRIEPAFFDALVGMKERLSLSPAPKIAAVSEYLSKDKKNRGGKISFIIARRAGETEEILLSQKELLALAAEKGL